MRLNRRQLRTLIESVILESAGDMTPILEREPAEDWLAAKDGAVTVSLQMAIGAGYWDFVGSRSEYKESKDTLMIAFKNDRMKAEDSARAKLKKSGTIDKNWIKSEEQVKAIAEAYDEDNEATGGALDAAMQDNAGMELFEKK
jgi:hypothetical protein